jgi:hypothetical protein
VRADLWSEERLAGPKRKARRDVDDGHEAAL